VISGTSRWARRGGIQASMEAGRFYAANMTTQIIENERVQTSAPLQDGTVYRVLIAVSFCHLMNDTMQSLLPSIYPILKTGFHLNFGQIGLLTLTFQMTASILQPFIGHFTDHKPMPYSLPIGMVFTLIGLLLLSIAPTFPLLLLAASLIGMGSAVFHPESSRVARLASGGRLGLAQSVFQVGGNTGSAIGPLLAAFIVLPHGQRGVAWFSLVALVAIVVLTRVSRWYKPRLGYLKKRSTKHANQETGLSRGRVVSALAVLIALVFSKYFYLASFTSYYTFYLMTRFHLGVRSSQIHLFVFLGAVAAGTLIGGPIGDRIGRKTVIWCSILGVLPLTMLLPYANLFWTSVLSVFVGLGLASAFPAILVYAQELVPGRVGMISGLFFGFAFGMGGIGAAILGRIADATSILFVYKICAYLPAIGLLAGLLPKPPQPLLIGKEVK
jgi:FSR family fosmidomycin resistance protein-like MFS transporter